MGHSSITSAGKDECHTPPSGTCEEGGSCAETQTGWTNTTRLKQSKTQSNWNKDEFPQPRRARSPGGGLQHQTRSRRFCWVCLRNPVAVELSWCQRLQDLHCSGSWSRSSSWRVGSGRVESIRTFSPTTAVISESSPHLRVSVFAVRHGVLGCSSHFTLPAQRCDVSSSRFGSALLPNNQKRAALSWMQPAVHQRVAVAAR